MSVVLLSIHQRPIIFFPSIEKLRLSLNRQLSSRFLSLELRYIGGVLPIHRYIDAKREKKVENSS